MFDDLGAERVMAPRHDDRLPALQRGPENRNSIGHSWLLLARRFRYSILQSEYLVGAAPPAGAPSSLNHGHRPQARDFLRQARAVNHFDHFIDILVGVRDR